MKKYFNLNLNFLIGPIATIFAFIIQQILNKTAYSIPNFPGIYVTLIVFSAFKGGYYSAFFSAAIGWSSTVIHFSIPGQLFHYKPPDLIRVITWAIIMPLNAWMTSLLRDKYISKIESEKVLQQKVIASSKMSALGEMAGGIAHEINNPLAIIQFRSEQLFEMLEERNQDLNQMIEAATTITNTCKRIARIINGLKLFSRDGSADHFEFVAIQNVISNTLDFCSEKFKNHNIPLEVQMPSTPLSVECREIEISQVLLNLINNAFDAIQDRREQWVRIAVTENANSVEILITDSGKGIPIDIQSKIMQPFFTTKELGKGTGLGLSISHGIIQSHSGEISIMNQSANTQFKIVIPKNQKKLEAA